MYIYVCLYICLFVHKSPYTRDSQKILYIFVRYGLQRPTETVLVTDAIQAVIAVVGSIVVVGLLTCCTLLQSV